MGSKYKSEPYFSRQKYLDSPNVLCYFNRLKRLQFGPVALGRWSGQAQHEVFRFGAVQLI